jgi:hypothetical protein
MKSLERAQSLLTVGTVCVIPAGQDPVGASRYTPQRYYFLVKLAPTMDEGMALFEVAREQYSYKLPGKSTLLWLPDQNILRQPKLQSFLIVMKSSRSLRQLEFSTQPN